MPQRAGFPNGILASWGKVELEPLDNDSIKALAEGRRAITKGYLVDFIGDFARSATNGLPIYRISGGAGFVWVASFDQRGRGTLRLTAVDASILPPTTAPRTPIDAAENAGGQNTIPHAETEKEPGAQAIDAGHAREDAEKARDETLSTKTDIDKAAAEERAKVDAVFAQLDAEKSAAEAEVRAMELVAYGGVIGLLVLVMVVASTRIQKTQATWPRRRPNKRHHLYQIQ
jgi:hypothetical protein